MHVSKYDIAQLQGKTRVVRSRVLLASSLPTRRQLLNVLYYIIAIRYYMWLIIISFCRYDDNTARNATSKLTPTVLQKLLLNSVKKAMASRFITDLLL